MGRIYADYSDDFLADALCEVGALIGDLKAEYRSNRSATKDAELREKIDAVTEVYNKLAEEQNHRILEAFTS